MISKLASVFAVSTFVLAATGSAHADTCRSVDLAVQNNKGMTILATSMEYKFSNDNVWRTEQFGNEQVAPGAFETVAFNQNLIGGEGNRLLGLKLHFQAWCGGHWSVPFVSQEDTVFDDTSDCQSFSGRSYRLDLPSSDVCD